MAKISNKVKTSDLELKDRLVAINRVTKVTKGGRTFSFSAIVVVGNEEGIVGWGLGKASEVTTAISKGVDAAKKNLVKIPVVHGTIPHEQTAKFGGANVPVLRQVVQCAPCLKVLGFMIFWQSQKVHQILITLLKQQWLLYSSYAMLIQ